MNGEGCRLNSAGRIGGRGGEVEPQSHHSGLITLEDLESFTGDLDSDLPFHGSESPTEDNGEVMELDEPDQLLNYWQDIGRGHRVDIPRGMVTPLTWLALLSHLFVISISSINQPINKQIHK